MDVSRIRRPTDSVCHRNNAAFRQIVENLPVGAHTCNADGLITYFNRRAVELWGREPKLNDPMDRY
jgi:PAS domain-containing protein